MTDPREPLTPADCDLQDFEFMPVMVRRLLKSETWALGNGDERAAAVALWFESWHQVPAASLPSDPRLLQRLSDSPKWAKVKDQALRGWVSCTDGRLYHPVVAEKALEAWIEKLINSISGASGNAKRWGVAIDTSTDIERLRTAVHMLETLEPKSKTLRKKAVLSIVAGSPPDGSAGSPPDSPPLSGGDRKGQGEGQGEGIGSSSLRSEEAGAAKPPRSTRPKKEETTLAAYLETCRLTGAKAIPEDHYVRTWAKDAGIHDEMLQVAWLTFKDRHIPKPDDKKPAKKQKDWPGTFANAVKGNWYRLWFIDGTEMKWTSQGQIELKVHEAQLAKHKAQQPEAIPA